MDKMLNSKQQSFDALKYLSPQAAEFVSEAYTLSLYILTGIHVQPCNNLSMVLSHSYSAWHTLSALNWYW